MLYLYKCGDTIFAEILNCFVKVNKNPWKKSLKIFVDYNAISLYSCQTRTKTATKFSIRWISTYFDLLMFSSFVSEHWIPQILYESFKILAIAQTCLKKKNSTLPTLYKGWKAFYMREGKLHTFAASFGGEGEGTATLHERNLQRHQCVHAYI